MIPTYIRTSLVSTICIWNCSVLRGGGKFFPKSWQKRTQDPLSYHQSSLNSSFSPTIQYPQIHNHTIAPNPMAQVSTFSEYGYDTYYLPNPHCSLPRLLSMILCTSVLSKASLPFLFFPHNSIQFKFNSIRTTNFTNQISSIYLVNNW